MTRGRCGSLDLHRMKLSFTTPHRFFRRTRPAVLPGVAGLCAKDATSADSPHLREGRTGRGNLHLHRRALAFIGRGGVGGGSDLGRAGSEWRS
jgi:hypothetical protein